MIYITTMYRWGSHENHSYILYAGESKEKAISLGVNETKHRGGKYDPEVIEMIDDTRYNIIHKLPEDK